MTIDFKALGAAAAAAGADQTKSKAGGGDFEAAAEGPALCRFIGYIETGKHEKTFKGAKSMVDEVLLVFELVGKRHPPRVLEDGTVLPHRITVREKLSLNEKANFFKLFTRMNYKQEAQHCAQLLGEGFKCEVIHDKWTGTDGKERTDVVLRNATGYTIAPPRKEDEDSETGWVDVAVPPAVSEIRCFIWNHADLAQWGGLFIDGEYPERKNDKGEVTAPAKSKNTLQNRIKLAKNFDGSPIHTLLLSSGAKLDIPAVGEDDDEKPVKEEVKAPAPSTPAAASNDALGGIV